MFIVSERHRLVYCEVPKCASTSMYRFFLNLNGIETPGNPRRFLAANAESLDELGLSSVELTGERLREFVAERPQHTYFSVVRDPYARVLSNYRNKLNRYTRQFDRRGYYQGKLAQLLRGPKAWGDANQAAECIGAFVSFEQFVRGLDRHGVDFDCHYQTQCDLLTRDVVSYDRLIPLEHLQAGIDELFATHRREDSLPPAARRAQQLNASTRSAGSEGWFTRDLKDLVYRLYRDDFEFLGYAR